MHTNDILQWIKVIVSVVLSMKFQTNHTGFSFSSYSSTGLICIIITFEINMSNIGRFIEVLVVGLILFYNNTSISAPADILCMTDVHTETSL